MVVLGGEAVSYERGIPVGCSQTQIRSSDSGTRRDQPHESSTAASSQQAGWSSSALCTHSYAQRIPNPRNILWCSTCPSVRQLSAPPPTPYASRNPRDVLRIFTYPSRPHHPHPHHHPAAQPESVACSNFSLLLSQTQSLPGRCDCDPRENKRQRAFHVAGAKPLLTDSSKSSG